MEVYEIKSKGKLVKSWKEMDGSWYQDTYKIYEVGGKYYQVKDHVCVVSGGIASYWGRVTEVEAPKPLPTHIAIILGQSEGEAYIANQRQGIPEELAEWAVDYISKSREKNLTMKMMYLNF